MPDIVEDTSAVTSSILLSVKKSLGIPPSVGTFDVDLILFINSVFSELNQLGVGPETPFTIEDDSATWDEFIVDERIGMVQAYMFLDVKLMFDPPAPSTITAMEKKRDEYEWRLNVAGDKSAFD